MKDKARIVDALLFRRVSKGSEKATLSVEQDIGDACRYLVLIETKHGTHHSEAEFTSAQQAVEFFDFATRKMLNDEEPMDLFDTRRAVKQFLNYH